MTSETVGPMPSGIILADYHVNIVLLHLRQQWIYLKH
jgi:hypothetical protein